MSVDDPRGTGSDGEREGTAVPPAAYGMAIPATPTPPGYQPTDPLRLTGGMSGETRTGRWVLPPYVSVHAMMSSVRLDCLAAQAPSPVVDLEIRAGMGSVTIVVPQGWAADPDRLSKGIGTVRVKVAREPDAGCPLLVLRGSSGVGTVTVRYPSWLDRKRHKTI